MTQTALTYRTNRDLFSNHYLTDHLRDTEPWNEVDDTEVREAYDEIRDLFEDKRDRVEDYNEAQLERNFIRPVFEIIGVSYEIEETVERNARRPDYGFFETDEAADAAFDRNNFYEEAIAVADAKRWGRKLDTRGEEKRDFENPSYQIHVYLQETPTTWAVLTNGQKWRLYYGPMSHRLDSYFEIDLPALLQHVEDSGSLEDFKDFYLFFRRQAFIEDKTGSCFLDEVYDESTIFAEALGEDLQDNIYEAIRVLAEGFLDSNDNLDRNDLDRIHDSSLIYLYRLIFVLYAESEGRNLLPTNNSIYAESYSLNKLKREVSTNLDDTQQHYTAWQTNLWERLRELFSLIDQGSKNRDVPEDQLYIPAYNGGLFRTNPDQSDSDESVFLSRNQVGDIYIARVIELLTRRDAEEGEGKVFVDYSSLDIRHLGSIYEGLLEYKLNIADQLLTVEDGQYVSTTNNKEAVVEEGDLYLTTDSGERKATGSYYTPEPIVENIVQSTLEPLVSDIREDLMAESAYGEDRGFAEEFAQRVFDLKVLDPAMGSGHFLTSAVDFLAREIINAQEKQAKQQGIETVDKEHDINWARRQVAQRCIYGVDLNPLAVELAKVSLWLRTLAAEQPLAFLDHHLKIGNSILGSDIEEIEEIKSERSASSQDTTLADFGITRKGTMEQLMQIYQDFIAIENRELDDIKEIESKYDDFEKNKLRQRIEAIADVRTARDLGLDTVPSDALERMVEALEDDSIWTDIKSADWYKNARTRAKEEKYFHWRLEYPEVFYDQSGEILGNPGFDAVIGNPPWVSFGLRDVGKLSATEKQYLQNNYETAEYKISTFPLFIEKAVSLCRTGGRQSFIVPDSFLLGMYFENTRDFIINSTNLNKLNLIMEDFWKDAEIGRSVVYSLSVMGEENQTEIGIAETLEDFAEEEFPTDRIPQSYFENQYRQQFRIIVDPVQRDIIEKVESQNSVMGDIGEFYSGCIGRYGQKTIKSKEKRDRYTIEDRSGEVVVEDDDASDHWEKLLPSGSNIASYAIFWDGTYVYVHPDEEVRKQYAKSGFDLEMYEGPKLFVRQTGDSLVAAVDDNKYFCLNNMHVLQIDDGFSEYQIGAILNSNLLEFYYGTISLEKGRTMAQTDIDDLENLPVPRTVRSSLKESCQILIELNEKFSSESRQFLKWISRFWEVNIEDLSLKTHLREYWEYDFEEMLRIAKRNKSEINHDVQSREFQERLESKWRSSIETLESLQDEIDQQEHKVSAEVFDLYDLNEKEVNTVLDNVDISTNEKRNIISEFRS
jgi:type II restriction/modification system DNA methylase subunit YeeA